MREGPSDQKYHFDLGCGGPKSIITALLLTVVALWRHRSELRDLL